MISITVKHPQGVFERLEEALVDAARKALRNIAVGAHREWDQAAGRFLNKSKPIYQDALQQPKKIDEDTFEIVLQHHEEQKNFLATAIEVGYDSFEILPGLLQSPSAYVWSRYSARGGGHKLGAPFLDVPFRTKSAITQQDPNEFKRASAISSGWTHPGFKPGGPRREGIPLREEAKKYIREHAQEQFAPLLAKIKL